MIVGIDLGTTHSLIGHFRDGRPQLFPNRHGDLLTPSVVGRLDSGEIVVGRAARELAQRAPERSVAAFKRYMGSDRAIPLGDRSFRPEELSALVLRSLLADAEEALGEKVAEAVISVPAYFSDAQRKATRAAGQLAGIKVERLINEPTAAALAYGLEQRDRQSRFLVFDLGGGTFDVSILELFEGVMEVHASAGDNFLGGEDFNELLLAAALADLGVTRDRLSPVERSQWQHRIESLKRRIGSETRSTQVFVAGGQEQEWSIDEARFESLSQSLLARMRAPVERAMRDSRTRPSDLAEIVLVGGATRMPMIARLVTRLFGRLPLRHIDPDRTVALGAAVMAGMKQRDQALDEVVMTDVSPYTLGIEVSRRTEHGVQHGLFSPIIERNSVVPVSRVERYSPMADHQKVLTLRAFQGESPRVSGNVFLGEIDIPLPGARAEDTPVDVRFTYDVNGLLEVEATVLSTNARHRLVIHQNPGVLDDDEIARRLAGLAELKVHPRDAQVNLAVKTRAERLYEENVGAARERISAALSEFDGLLASQDLRRIAEFRRQFEEFLDQVDQSPLT